LFGKNAIRFSKRAARAEGQERRGKSGGKDMRKKRRW